MLRDAAGLALGDVRLADRVEERRLAVVDVAHDGHDGRARNALADGGHLGRLRPRRLGGRLVDRGLLAGELELLLEGDDRRLDAELPGDLDGRSSGRRAG